MDSESENIDLAQLRATPPQQQQQQQQPTQQQQQQPAADQLHPAIAPAQSRAATPISNGAPAEAEPTCEATPIAKQATPPQPTPPPSRLAGVQRAVSMPASASPAARQRQAAARVNYSQSDSRDRPTLNRSTSRKEMIKNYIKKETATFFGVDEENENEEQLRWLDRRKRMAARTLGPLKDEYRATGRVGPAHRRAASELAPPAAGWLVADRPDVLPAGSDSPDAGRREGLRGTGLRRKDSVARMTWDGLSYVVATLTRHRPRPRSQQTQWSRSLPPETPDAGASEEEAFFEGGSDAAQPPPAAPAEVVDAPAQQPQQQQRQQEEAQLRPPHRDRERSRYSARVSSGWRREHEDVVLRHGETRQSIGGRRILSSTIDHVMDNSNRRMYGMGWVGRMFGRSIRRSVVAERSVRAQLDDMDDHRPLFTYWVTTVQVLVLCISVACYGVGPFGVGLRARSGQVLVTSLSLQQVDYMEPANFWYGPRAGDLIHLGAKFAPCMRVDEKITQQMDKIRAKEKETACCIRNDDSGCVQSSQADCSKTISTWKKWTTGDAGPGGRISGSVCGLDPKFCDAPASVHPYEWPDDITKWPICRKTSTSASSRRGAGSSNGGPNGGGGGGAVAPPRDKLAEHMVCEVIGHPCCIGVHGTCRITTREYCDFVLGTFHEEASLCSQVSCLNDVCGMLPFYTPDVPDQFYRLWTSLFLHAGILQLAVTLHVQLLLMRDLEKLTGSLRIGIIYIGSGVAGNLASAIFVPYRADVGPAGSQFGLLACLIVEVLQAWPMLKRPHRALGKLLAITLALFLLGLLPWVDNYAHLFGFAFGFLLAYALLPFVSFGRYDRRRKIVLIWMCLASAGVLFACLVLLFYVIPVYDCKVCSYFNCLPLTRDFCASQNINFKREDSVV